MYRVSTDDGKTFSDKINLSNSPNADATDQNIDVGENLIAVTWWERNATSNISVMRISTDNGKTLRPILKLAKNGTIGIGSGSGGG
jgi:tricorn protease-like protein